jgi:8-oxo-dGTP pyrophosphatase MutT (NUDIX family)
MKKITGNDIRKRLNAITMKDERHRMATEGYRTASVLVPVICEADDVRLLFTRRTELVETHKGQVSFPGGMMDADDADVIRTALREAWEEVGIPDSAVRVLGMLDDLATPTGFVITPVVGILERPPQLSPNKDEVAEVFQVPLLVFADPANGRTEMREFRGTSHEVWFYEQAGHTIWGATAMIVRSLLRRLELVPAPRTM